MSGQFVQVGIIGWGGGDDRRVACRALATVFLVGREPRPKRVSHAGLPSLVLPERSLAPGAGPVGDGTGFHQATAEDVLAALGGLEGLHGWQPEDERNGLRTSRAVGAAWGSATHGRAR